MSEIWSKKYIGLHVQHPLLLSDFNENNFLCSVFEKYSNIILCENPFNGALVVPCGRADERTDMTQLTVAYRNFANAPNNIYQ